MQLLDGPMGTQLARAGVSTPAPGWSAPANASHPDLVRRIHRAYAEAGATVHTANTFRTTARGVGGRWQKLAALAVEHARCSVPSTHRVAGSIAPLADCYRPDLSPARPRPEHRQLVRYLAGLGIDLFLVETFAHPAEAHVAVEEAVATGLPTWLALTAGPEEDLLTPARMRQAAHGAVQRGASAVLVNCVPASSTGGWLEAVAGLGVPIGAYANAGHPDEGLGWGKERRAAERYSALARGWIDRGATLLGSCCGTGPEHIRALRAEIEAHRG